MNKPILCLDFDGVIHSYKSGWHGAAVIPDPPVPGALEFIVTALDSFTVAIFSSRSHQWGGRRAMKRWLHHHLYVEGRPTFGFNSAPQWWVDRISRTAFADPWSVEVDKAASAVIKEIQWPIFKPPAHITIDDRAYEFQGKFPSLGAIASFKPWNKR